MRLKTILTFSFFFLGLSFAADLSILCPINEEFLKCGTACPATCKHIPEICTENCIQGCFCMKGYVRIASGGPCIPEKDCEKYKCGKNEIFSTCATLCPRTCNDDEPRFCPLICIFGCVCKEGFVRDKLDGRCIPEGRCRDVCSKNRVYSDCGTACPGTCSEPVKICNKKCVKGCFCKEGYVQQDDTKECVKLEGCPSNC